MRCASCDRVNADDAAFCSGCGTRLEKLCPSCTAPYEQGSAFCSKCGARLEGEGASSTADELQRYLPAGLLKKLRAARHGRAMAGERRMVTMLFADIQGSTAAAEQLDPEEWGEIVNGAFERLIRPVYRFEGTLARLMGDAILAFFGAPIAHEDDPERAVRAGLAMLDDARPYAEEVKARWGIDFDLRVGINTGLVVVGEIGSDLRVEYTAIGDAVNVAARMEQVAEPGTLLISANTHRLVDTLFDFESRGPTDVKGKSAPVDTYRVIGVRAGGTAGDADSTRIGLVGRDAELETLRSVAADVRAGGGEIVSIIGDAGVGKSRLISALRDELEAQDCFTRWAGAQPAEPRRMRWAEARCLSYNTAIAYAPFIDLATSMFGLDGTEDAATTRSRVRQAVGAVGVTDADQTTTYLCVMLGVPPTGDEAAVVAELPAPTLQRRVFGAMVGYVQACATAGPAIIVFEDLHWADSVSLALLEELLRTTDRATLGVIALMRPYRDDASWQFHETAQRSFAHRYHPIELEPLNVEATRSLLRELVGGDLADDVESALLQRADGNPFFVEEMVRGLSESKTAASEIPTSIASLLTSRIDRLEAPSKLAVHLASVLGREFQFGELADLVGDVDDTEHALADLLRRNLIVERNRVPERDYSFRHALIQETAYNTILLKDRRSLHAQVAGYLEPRDPDPQEMARHLVESRQEAKAVPYLVAAADQAVRAMNLAEAIRLYDRTLTWASDTDDEFVLRAHEGLGSAYSLIPDLTKASSTYQRMLEFGRTRAEPSVQITALNRLGFTTAFLGGDLERAGGYLEDARRLAEQIGDDMGLAEYHMGSCMIATRRGDLEAAAAHDAETARLGSATGTDRVRIGGLLQRAQSLLYGAQFEEGRRALEHARQATEGSTDVTIRSGIAASELILLMVDGELDEALAAGRRATELALGIGSSTSSVLSLFTGIAASVSGHHEDAIAFFSEAIRTGEELGQPFNVAAAAASMLRVYTELGITTPEVAALHAKALGLLDAPLGDMLASTVYSQLGWAALARGDHAEAAQLFDTARRTPSASMQLERPSVLAGQALCAVHAGDLEGAQLFASEAAAFVEERGMAFFRPLVASVMGVLEETLGRLDAAVEVVSEGASYAKAIGATHAEWLLLAAKAGVLREVGRVEDADGEVAEAQTVVDKVADRFADPGLRDAFLVASRARLALLTRAG